MSGDSKGEGEKTGGMTVNVFPESVAKEIVPQAYSDVVQPAAKEVGRALETVGLVANAILMPLRVLAKSWNDLEPSITQGIASRLEGKDPLTIQSPPTNILVPTLQAYAVNEQSEELRELFLNLLAASMDSTRRDIHPSFTEVLKQMTTVEARILQSFFAEKKPIAWYFEAKSEDLAKPKQEYQEIGCPLALTCKDISVDSNDDVASAQINLARLGLIREHHWEFHEARTAGLWRRILSEELLHRVGRIEEWLACNPEVSSIIEPNSDGVSRYYDDGFVFSQALRFSAISEHLTEYGRAFCLACVNTGDPRGVAIPSRGRGIKY